MKRFVFILLLSFVFFAPLFASFANAQESALDMLRKEGITPRRDVNPMDSFSSYQRQAVFEARYLLNDAEIINRIAGTKSFLGLFTVIYDFVVTLAAIWAVLMLVYLGAKYALVDSVTGKQMAKENMLPVVTGLIALLGSYILFKQINPQLVELNLNFDKKNLQVKSALDVPVRATVKRREEIISMIRSDTKKWARNVVKEIGQSDEYCGGIHEVNSGDYSTCKNLVILIKKCAYDDGRVGNRACDNVKRKREDIIKYVFIKDSNAN